MGDTLKVTDDYLKNLADNQIRDLMRSMSGTNSSDQDGTKVVGHIFDFASGTGGLPTVGDNYTALLAGTKPFTEGVQLSTDFTKFVGQIKGQLDAIANALQTLRDAAYDAQTTFNNAEDDALTAAQMFQVLSGSNGGPTPPP